MILGGLSNFRITLYNLEGKITQVSGTSFAAPHITASVALLQEYGLSSSRGDEGSIAQLRR